MPVKEPRQWEKIEEMKENDSTGQGQDRTGQDRGSKSLTPNLVLTTCSEGRRGRQTVCTPNIQGPLWSKKLTQIMGSLELLQGCTIHITGWLHQAIKEQEENEAVKQSLIICNRASGFSNPLNHKLTINIIIVLLEDFYKATWTGGRKV